MLAEIRADEAAAVRQPGEVDLLQIAALMGGSISVARRYADARVASGAWSTRKVYDAEGHRRVRVWRKA